MTAPLQIAAALDAAVAPRSLLSHPFYRAWVAGELDLGDLALYAGQYWRQVESFPACLDTLSSRVPAAACVTLRDNLADELQGNHLQLWRDFAAALGVVDLDHEGVLPETSRCRLVFSRAAAEAPIAFALGAIYGYESQTPEVAATKADGLRTNYRLGEEAIAYFDVHATVDVEHTARLAEAIEDVTGNDEDLVGTAARGAAAGAAAIWGLLDGVWAAVQGRRRRSLFVVS